MWIGGRLIWPFAVETRTLLAAGDLRGTLTPTLAIGWAFAFLLAASLIVGHCGLVVAGAVLSIALQQQ